MRSYIFTITTICALLFSSAFSEQKPTILTFVAESQNEQEEDYIELNLSVKAQGTSLVGAMAEAKRKAQQIQTMATEFCQVHAKKKSQCKNIVDISNHKIKPEYKTVKRNYQFMGFEVEHEISVKVFAVNHVSNLADILLESTICKILSFAWKPLKQTSAQQLAVKQGMLQGSALCYEIGMHLDNIKNLEQVKKGKNQQTSIYKFGIECLPGQKQQQLEKKEKPKDKNKNKNQEQPKQSKGKKEKKKKSSEKKKKKEKKEKVTAADDKTVLAKGQQL